MGRRVGQCAGRAAFCKINNNVDDFRTGQECWRRLNRKVERRFAAAARDIKCLSVMPANLDLLALYGLYAQATKGDQAAKKPGWTNLKARGTWEYWHKHRGKGKAEAMPEYIELVEEFKVKYRFDASRTPVEVGGKWKK